MAHPRSPVRCNPGLHDRLCSLLSLRTGRSFHRTDRDGATTGVTNSGVTFNRPPHGSCTLAHMVRQEENPRNSRAYSVTFNNRLINSPGKPSDDRCRRRDCHQIPVWYKLCLSSGCCVLATTWRHHHPAIFLHSVETLGSRTWFRNFLSDSLPCASYRTYSSPPRCPFSVYRCGETHSDS
jgi:hypothetical protein